MRPGQARLRDPEALKRLRSALIEFTDEIGAASAEADGQIGRATQWLTREQPARWKAELRRREDKLGQMRSALTRKKGQGVGTPPTAMEERKAVDRAKRAVDEAQEVLRSLGGLSTALDRAASQYRGRAQRLNSIAQRDLPMGVAAIDGMLDAIDRYLAEAPPESGPRAHDPGAERAGHTGTGRRAPAMAAAEAGWASLRARTCEDAERFGLHADEIGPIPPTGSHPGEIGAASALADATRVPVADGDRVVLVEGVLTEAEVYLERVETSLRADSGWFIGPAGGPISEPLGTDREVRSCRIDEVVRAVPAVAGLLTLGYGSLLVLRKGRLIAVLGADDRVLWQAEPASEPEGGV